MDDRYLEVTYRRGRPLAAYLYLPRRRGDWACRTRPAGGGLLVDYARGNRPIGIEITAPSKATLAAINRLLRSLGEEPIARRDLAPLNAA